MIVNMITVLKYVSESDILGPIDYLSMLRFDIALKSYVWRLQFQILNSTQNKHTDIPIIYVNITTLK